MRQWHVPCDMLCDKHLLGEHVEHHMFRSIITKGTVSVQGYIDDNLLAPGTLKARHDEIVREMEYRGMLHKSPYEAMPDDVLSSPPGSWSLRDNMREIGRRCTECRKRIESGVYARHLSDVPEGGDYYRGMSFGADGFQVYISGKLVGMGTTKAKAIQVMEKTRKKMRKDGSIWR